MAVFGPWSLKEPWTNVEEISASGTPHRIEPVGRHKGPFFVLDFPLSHEHDARPYRCMTCKRAALMEDEDMTLDDVLGSRVSHRSSYWSVGDDDIRPKFPTALVCKLPRRAPV